MQMKYTQDNSNKNLNDPTASFYTFFFLQFLLNIQQPHAAKINTRGNIYEEKYGDLKLILALTNVRRFMTNVWAAAEAEEIDTGDVFFVATPEFQTSDNH